MRVPSFLSMFVVLAASLAGGAMAQEAEGLGGRLGANGRGESPPANPRDSDPDPDRPTLRVRPLASVGVTLGVTGVTYGVAPDIRAGVALVLSKHHELTVALGVTPYTLEGLRLDLFALEAGYRLRPFAGGLFVRASLGPALAREALSAKLPQVTLSSHRWAGAVVGTVGVGWTLFGHVDLEIYYRHAGLVFDGIESLGAIGFALGGQL